MSAVGSVEKLSGRMANHLSGGADWFGLGRQSADALDEIEFAGFWIDGEAVDGERQFVDDVGKLSIRTKCEVPGARSRSNNCLTCLE